jgi:hypothetical protein
MSFCRRFILLGSVAVSLASASCRQTAPPLRIEIVPASLSVQSKVVLQVACKKAGRPLAIPANEIAYRAARGQMIGTIYHAPMEPGEDTITVRHLPSGTETQLSLAIVERDRNCSQADSVPPTANDSLHTVTNWPADKASPAGEVAVLTSTAVPEKPSSNFKTYTATQELPAIPEVLAQEDVAKNYQRVVSAHFSLAVPEAWEINASDLGCVARHAPTASAKKEVHVTVLPGIDFLNPRVIRLLFHQQVEQIQKDIQQTGEDEVTIAGERAQRIIFANYGTVNNMAWWIFLKKYGSSYVIILQGPPTFFADEEKTPQQILRTFRFTSPATVPASQPKTFYQLRPISAKYCTISIPSTWRVLNASGNFWRNMGKEQYCVAGISDEEHGGKKMVLFLLIHRQPAVENLDINVILLLFRQMLTQEVIQQLRQQKEENLTLIHTKAKAKLLEFEDGDVLRYKTWLVGFKQSTTVCGLLLRGPKFLWEAQPDIPNQILQSFTSIENE